MATRYYNGATNTTYTDTGNWVGGSAPVSGDSVVILATCVNDIDGSDQTGTTLVSFRVMPGCAVNIGSSGTKLQLACDKFSYAGSCPEAWIALRDGNGAGNVTQVDIFAGYEVSTTTAATEGLHLTSGTTDTMSPCRVHGGYVSFDSTSRIPTYVQNGGTAFVNDATGIGTCYGVAGTTHWNATQAVTTLEVGSQSTWNHEQDTGAITTVNNRGQFYPKGAGTITTLNGWEGDIKATLCERIFTVTNCTLYNGNLDVRNQIGTPTFSNPISVVGNGQVYGDPARTSNPVTAL